MAKGWWRPARVTAQQGRPRYTAGVCNLSLGIAGCKCLGNLLLKMVPKRRTKGARLTEAATMKAQLVSVCWGLGCRGSGGPRAGVPSAWHGEW